MPDWSANVREQLGALRLEPAEAEEILDELAGHLEECYDALLARGVPEEEAFARACEQAGSWKKLRRGVTSAKREGIMQKRVKQFWMPALVTLLAGWGLLTLLILSGVQPVMWYLGDPPTPIYLIFYWPWLVLLPLIGAAGGYMSRKARASGWRVYLVGSFPALAMACVFLVILPWSLVVDAHVVRDFAWLGLTAMTFSWVILPGIALCIGVVLEGLRKAKAA